MSNYTFLEPKITSGDILTYAEAKVNLRRETAASYREQANRVRAHIERYIEEHPEIGFEKILLSGSLAKFTALRTIKDIDLALYVSNTDSPHELGALLQWLVERLHKTYPQIPIANIKIDGPCVVISFSGSDLDVEIAPVRSLQDAKGRGYLYDRQTLKPVLTSIPLHIDFIRSRKKKADNFTQAIRLGKWWAKNQSGFGRNLQLKSFLIEMLFAKVSDSGATFLDYYQAMEDVFLYIQKSQLKERISFKDNYNASQLPSSSTGAVEIFDPVNPENNVASYLSESDRIAIVNAAEDALDNLCFAKTCTTKAEATACLQNVFGPTFNF